MFYHCFDFDSVLVPAGKVPTFFLKMPLLVRDSTQKTFIEIKFRDFFFMLCMKTAFRLIHEHSFKYLKYPKNKLIVLISVNPKDLQTYLSFFPTVIIRQVFFLIQHIKVVIQSFLLRNCFTKPVQSQLQLWESISSEDTTDYIYLGFLTFLEKSHWAGTLHQQCNFSILISNGECQSL